MQASWHVLQPSATGALTAGSQLLRSSAGVRVRSCHHHGRAALPRVQAVPLAVLRTLRSRLASLLATAEQFRDPLGPAWLPRVGAAICAAHYVEHSLRCAGGALPQGRLQGAAAFRDGTRTCAW